MFVFPKKQNRNIMVRLFKSPEKQCYDGYLLALNWLDPVTPEKGLIHILKVTREDSGKQLAMVTGPIIPWQRRIKVSLKITDERLNVYLEGQRIFSVADTSLRRGIIGLGAFRSQVHYQDLTVTGQVAKDWYRQRVAATSEGSETKEHWHFGDIDAAQVKTIAALPKTLRTLWHQGRLSLIQGRICSIPTLLR